MTVLVAAQGLSVSFNKTAVLDEVTTSLSAGQEVALTGRSGSGKSTLLLALAGLLPATGVGWPGLSDDPVLRRSQIGVVFQAPSLLPELTALENVALPLRLRGVGRDPAYASAATALAEVALTDAAGALPDELSGGQQQRVSIARVLAAKPLLLIADEPTGSLDTVTAEAIVKVLRTHVTDTGGAMLLATHDEDLADLLPGRMVLRDGRLTMLDEVAA